MSGLLATRRTNRAAFLVIAGAAAAGLPLLAGAHRAHQPVSGQEIFRFDTFGSEPFWTGTLRLHEVIETVTPVQALELGLKVDADALPPELVQALLDGLVDLNDPQTTLALLSLDAVVGVRGTVEEFAGINRLTSIAITCALCHSTVDDSILPGVGSRLDGWANLDLDPGAIIALSPVLPQEVRDVYNSWGPGFYDPRFNVDGINHPVVIPPAFGLAGVPKATYTGDGNVSYWNKYVAVTQMGGQGTFIEPRLGIHIHHSPDLVQRKLPALRQYQLSLATPPPPPGSFDPAAAERGSVLFHGAAGCSQCHAPPTYGGGGRLHDPADVGQDPTYAQRTLTGKYRATPLRALWQEDRPFFHDGSAATLSEVVDHYDSHFMLDLTAEQKADLVEFLKSL